MLTIVTPPASEPVSLEEAKAFLRVDYPTDNLLIESLISAAREFVERYTRRALITQTRAEVLEAWPTAINAYAAPVELSSGPVSAIDSITYVAADEASTVLSSAVYSLYSPSRDRLPMVLASYRSSWPTVLTGPNAIKIQYVAGWVTAAAVPAPLRQAILRHASWCYTNREPATFGAFPEGSQGVMERAIERSLVDFRLFSFA